MKDIRIRPRIPAKQAKGILKDLGAYLSGRKPDIYGIREVFFGTMAFTLYGKIRQGFLQKSAGGADEFGGSWTGLSEATVKRRVTSWFSSRYPLSADLQINRVDDTLLNSLSPGNFDGFSYTPTSNQYFKYDDGKLKLGSSLNYASHVHSKRPLWPDNMTPWIRESISKAIEATILHIKRQVE